MPSAHQRELPIHFRSKSVEWTTPPDLFAELDAEFHFDLDVAASHENALCARYFTKEIDGLRQPWRGICWMNPPYGREIGAWLRKAWQSAAEGATIVCLLPARTDTTWWHDYVAHADEIRLLRGRLKFSNSHYSAPFSSAIVVFRPRSSANRAERNYVVFYSKTAPPKESSPAGHSCLSGRQYHAAETVLACTALPPKTRGHPGL